MKSAKTIERMFKGFRVLSWSVWFDEQGDHYHYSLSHISYSDVVTTQINLHIATKEPTDPRSKREWLQAKEIQKALQSLISIK